MKSWIRKDCINLLKKYPQYYDIIITSKMNSFMLHLYLLLREAEDTNIKEERLKIINIIMTILYDEGIDIIYKQIKDIKYQKLISVILSRIKVLKKELIDEKKVDIELYNNLDNLYNLIKEKIIIFNIMDELKDLILEYY